MKLLVVYGTSEGQTKKIAEAIGKQASDASHSVTLLHTKTTGTEIDVETFDAVIVAGSVHQERHQESVVDFALARKDQLAARANAFVSVSLAIAAPDGKDQAQKYVDRFVNATGWQPQNVLLLAGALRFSGYDYFKEQIVKHIVLETTGTNDGSGDHEFTDWDELRAFVDRFLQSVS